jgi:hypothetical protein
LIEQSKAGRFVASNEVFDVLITAVASGQWISDEGD